MQSVLKLKARVLPGKRIEFTAPELPEGGEVEVTVVVPETAPAEPRPALEIIRSLGGRRLFSSPDEVDQYLREERDSWEK